MVGLGPGINGLCETVPGTGEVARFPAETLGTHKDGNTEYINGLCISQEGVGCLVRLMFQAALTP
jgi:hypothetical protein